MTTHTDPKTALPSLSMRAKIAKHEAQAAKEYRVAIESFMAELGITAETAGEYALVKADEYDPSGLPAPDDVVMRTVILHKPSGKKIGEIELTVRGLYDLRVNCRREGV